MLISSVSRSPIYTLPVSAVFPLLIVRVNSSGVLKLAIIVGSGVEVVIGLKERSVAVYSLHLSLAIFFLKNPAGRFSLFQLPFLGKE